MGMGAPALPTWRCSCILPPSIPALPCLGWSRGLCLEA